MPHADDLEEAMYDPDLENLIAEEQRSAPQKPPPPPPQQAELIADLDPDGHVISVQKHVRDASGRLQPAEERRPPNERDLQHLKSGGARIIQGGPVGEVVDVEEGKGLGLGSKIAIGVGVAAAVVGGGWWLMNRDASEVDPEEDDDEDPDDDDGDDDDTEDDDEE